jgi:AraC-like DNA-binding protein
MDRLKEDSKNSKESLALRQMIESVLESRVDDPDFSASALAAEFGVSASQMNRWVWQLFGLNPARLIITRRLRLAASMMQKDPSRTITCVAFSSGFNHLAYFAKIFRKIYGVSPSAYRERFTYGTQTMNTG